MENKIVDNIIKGYLHEYYQAHNFEQCLEKAKVAYELLERDQFKDTKENFHIYMTLLVILKCKIQLKRSQTKEMRKYILLSLRYSLSKSDKMFSYYLLSKYYEWIGNLKKRKYNYGIALNYEKEVNEGCLSKTYKEFIKGV